MRRRRLFGVLIGWSVLAALGSIAPDQALAEPERDVEFTISDPRIVESSGLATDPARRVYWTINDTGDPGMLYALNGKGRTVGIARFDATPNDVEAIAYSDGTLFVGDTGGNRVERDVVSVYAVVDPELSDDDEVGFVSHSRFEFGYPDGAKDTEAMTVTAEGRFLFITKGVESGGVYLAPTLVTRDSPNPLTRVGDAPQYVTDATVLADGRIVLRSYVAVFVLDPTTYQIVASAATPSLKQGESITVALDGKGLLIGTEGVDSEVLRIPVPTEIGRVPTISPSPDPSPSQSPTPQAPPPSESGTALPLVIGGVGVALGAVGLFLFRRRRART